MDCVHVHFGDRLKFIGSLNPANWTEVDTAYISTACTHGNVHVRLQLVNSLYKSVKYLYKSENFLYGSRQNRGYGFIYMLYT